MSPTEHSVLDVAGVQSAHIHTMWNVLMYVCGVDVSARGCLSGLGIAAGAAGRARLRAAATPWDSRRAARLDRHRDRRLVRPHHRQLCRRSGALCRPRNPKACTLKVTSQQWWWAIEYLSDRPSERFQTANEIHLPVNVPVEIQLRSPDVIHSFWVPNLHGKQDLIPGRDTDIHLQPTRTGVFRGQCAEFCGAQHANMAIYVVVESRSRISRDGERGSCSPRVDPSDDCWRNAAVTPS